MAEQQLVDYIKKAREAKQPDAQTRSLLSKNGWTEPEVDEAFSFIDQPEEQPKPEVELPEIQPQIASQPIIDEQPKVVETQPEISVEPEKAAEPEKPQAETVQPQAQVSATILADDMPETKHKSHIFLKLLIVLIIVVLLCGAGLFAAGQYINLPWNPFWPNPATVISKMEANMQNVRAEKSNIQLGVNVTDRNEVLQGKLSLNGTVASDITDASNPKSDSTFDIALTLPGAATTSSGSAVESATVSARLISLGNIAYFELSNIKISDARLNPKKLGGIDITPISGIYFKIDQDSIKALTSADSLPVGAVNISRANNLVLSENIISFDKQLPDETVSGQSTYHYLLTITKDKLKDFLTKVVALQTSNNTQDASNAFVQSMASAFVNSFTDAIGDTNVEIWVGKQDSMLYGLKIDKTIDLSKISAGPNSLVGLSLDMTNSDFNSPTPVKAPADSIKIENILLPLIKTQKLESDMNQIGDIAQLLFGTAKSYSTLCRGGLLNGYLSNYGASFVSLSGDIVSQGGKKPSCFSLAQDYCVSTQLSDGTWLCRGSATAGFTTGTQKCISAKTVCK
jgi:hypothetical protein